MQLQQLIKDTRASNPKFETEETEQAYNDRVYHLALMAWERVPESEKEPDDVPEPEPVAEPKAEEPAAEKPAGVVVDKVSEV